MFKKRPHILTPEAMAHPDIPRRFKKGNIELVSRRTYQLTTDSTYKSTLNYYLRRYTTGGRSDVLTKFPMNALEVLKYTMIKPLPKLEDFG